MSERSWLVTGRVMNENGNFRRTRHVLSESFTRGAAERELKGIASHEGAHEYKALKVVHASETKAKRF